MKRFLWMSLCLLAGCTATEQAGEQTTTDAADSAVVASRPALRDDYDQLRGVWLNTKFEATLEKTRSPRRAAVDVPNVSFFREGGKAVAFVNLGFREGITIPLDSLQRVGNELKHDEVTLLLSPRGDEMTLQLADRALMKGKATFRRFSRADLPSMEAEHDTLMRHINRVVLAGRYRDDAGNFSHVFSEDMMYGKDAGDTEGKLVDLPYALEMNIAVKGCDGVFSQSRDGKTGGRLYTGFAWKGKTLELYRTEADPDNPEGLIREKKPIAKLTRTGPASASQGVRQ